MTTATQNRPLIMVTNDDGVLSLGLQQLADALAELGEVVIVAPDRERSAAGHSMTLDKPVRADRIRSNCFAVDGTPTDCVNLGVHGLLPRQPDLLVSGINKGSNLADDITYSGTVAAAMEAMLMQVPALAVSLDLVGLVDVPDFSYACRYARHFSQQILLNGLPSDTFLNMNIPQGCPKGVRLTRQGKRVYDNKIEVKRDPRGRDYYWLGGNQLGFVRQTECDCGAIADGYVSVTPLHLDLTNYQSVKQLSNWDLCLL
ncbi:MAG: 5'/3'-nucleotidase SurE [Desulfuromonas sp.]|nr:5'/3'-nucleotidase SurE [Desulfuromonas sp.]